VGKILGTSMATPHVVGLVALLKTNNLLWSPSTLAFVMMTIIDFLPQW
jgi:NO-binding membrane sensor protein with MHYT domain